MKKGTSTLNMNLVNKQNNQLTFITVLKLIATCLITNTHYNHVYPSEAFAVGGLIGDVIFFGVSGYCYAYVFFKQRFFYWYLKRIIRVYPAVIVMLVFHALVGYWDVSKVGFFRYYIFPTNFTFVGALMIVYIAVYLYSSIVEKRKSFFILVCILLSWLALYIFVFDKDRYFMNDTNHLSCLILYGLSSMIGVYLGKYDKAYSEEAACKKTGYAIILMILLIGYYYANKMIRYNNSALNFQIIIPIILLFIVFILMKLFICLESVLVTMSPFVRKPVSYISKLTLEIYVVQRMIIRAFENIVFPINWIIITFLIIIASILLHAICRRITQFSMRIDSSR